MDLIERTFQREGSLYIACNDRNAFFTSDVVRNYNLWSCKKVCEALTFLLDNIYIRFGSKLYRQIVGIPMGTNCAPLVPDLFLFCYERDFMLSLSEDNQSGVISSPEHEVLMVSYCDQSMSVVRRASSVVRRASSTICFKS